MVDAAQRNTEAFLCDAPAAQVEAQHARELEAYDRDPARLTMRALFTKTPAESRSVNENAATIYPLWDGAADATPPTFAGKSFTPGHQPYLTIGSAQVDGQDVADLTDKGLNGTDRLACWLGNRDGG